MQEEKPVVWLGSARRDLQGFPAPARAQAGRVLHVVQGGRDPADWRPMRVIGSGVREIRIRTAESGRVDHRVFYVAKFPEAVYVLHAFKKTTRKTSERDIGLGRQRYAELLALRHRREEPRGR
ncbi:MAG: type II toxin-antitoxin system RelE/ParE family toxin [Gemmatimonadetes bacterium]|nr:type II toxin-antitoxin system RelE/ParE family toxin [Gemmatimonadota bacterium]